MYRTGFLGTLAAASAILLPPGRGQAAAASADDIRAKLLPGQRLVAFAVTDSATVIDFAGPWEVFQDTPLPGHDNEGVFVQYLVGPAMTAVEATAGMQLMPRYTFANAPRPDIVVVGAQRGSPEL